MLYTCKENGNKCAFSRVELLVSIVAATLLAIGVFSGSAFARSRSQRMTCVDNLRQVGQAFQLWGFEHQDSVPWNLDKAQGGTRALNKTGNPFREFSVVSNELASPKVLICPSDERRNVRVAENWTGSPVGGFLNPGYANNATSYSIGLHANFVSARSLLSLDRGVRIDASGVNCSTGVNNASAINLFPTSSVVWTNSLHANSGNVLFVDGRVAEVPSSQLANSLSSVQSDGNPSAHLLIP